MPCRYSVKVDQSTAGSAVLTFADSKVVLTAEPFRMDLVQNDSPVISVNARGLFNFEHHRPNPEKYVVSTIVRVVA